VIDEDSSKIHLLTCTSAAATLDYVLPLMGENKSAGVVAINTTLFMADHHQMIIYIYIIKLLLIYYYLHIII
jgi:hypothetical protein